MSTYGQVGLDVGTVGRWFRLISGILIMSFVLWDFIGGEHTHSLTTNMLIGVFLLGFVLAYLVVYLLIADRLKDKNPWIATIVFVFPAIYFSVINGMVVPYEWSFGYLIGLPSINHPITLAMLLYIGISLPIQFVTRYGGCEVIAIQNLIYRKRCSSYCVPLLPLDVVEKKIVDRIAQRQKNRSRAEVS